MLFNLFYLTTYQIETSQFTKWKMQQREQIEKV